MNMEKEKIKENFGKLRKSPLFTLSLGSKELFHSNFLYWLINAGILGTEKNGKEITGKELFTKAFNIISDKPMVPTGNWIAKREKMNFDLSLWENEKVVSKNGKEEIKEKCILVIENKLKSVPRASQIQEYQNKFKDKNESVPGFILLTLMENFPDRGRIEVLGCEILSYRQLASQLSYEIENIKFSKEYFHQLIKDYCDFVLLLAAIGEEDKISKKKSLMLDFDKQFDELRILQLMQALRVGELYSLIHYELDKDKKYKDIKFNTGYGRNGGAFLEIFYAPGEGRDAETGKEQEKEDKKGFEEPSHRSIGIQIQDNRYSHFVCPLDNAQQDFENVEKKFKGFFASSNKQFPELISEGNISFDKNNSGDNKILLSFQSKKEGYSPRFAYQYAIIPQDADYGLIVDQVVKDIDFILENFKEKDLENE